MAATEHGLQISVLNEMPKTKEGPPYGDTRYRIRCEEADYDVSVCQALDRSVPMPEAVRGYILGTLVKS